MFIDFLFLFGEFAAAPDAQAECFHSDQADSGLLASVNRLFHIIIKHEAEVIARHYCINPTDFCGCRQTLGHIAVSAEAEEPDFLLLFGFFDPLFQVIGEH